MPLLEPDKGLAVRSLNPRIMQSPEPTYYAARAREYERVYRKPERQAELARLRAEIPAFFADLAVLEVACGTGYWTQYIAQAARRVCATDLAEETLAVAREKALAPDRVAFHVADAMHLPASLGTFQAAFCGFWWSHVPRTSIGAFLDSLHARLIPGAKVLLLDNLYVEGSSTPVSRRSASGDTWQMRQLSDGPTYEVLKNFPTESELRTQTGARATDVQYRASRHYWVLTYRCALQAAS
jgi:demethylmenaquinone methyltransferase/2-methoxy-6-polyprenyl-1,4-benzoquinol methylase